jgi:hypothetical protein
MVGFVEHLCDTGRQADFFPSGYMPYGKHDRKELNRLISDFMLNIRTAPIQIIVCAILLILQIGPSALVGLALFAFLIPLQSKVS